VSATNLFGIEGLTIGGLGIWGILLLLAGSLAVWWIRGMPDRKRADNEAIPAEAAASNALFKNMQAEMKRMAAQIARLDRRVTDLEAEKSSLVRERDAALAENARLRAVNHGQGQMRQEAAAIVAVDRLVAKQKERGNEAG
jgi:predicted transcriptional regulator